MSDKSISALNLLITASTKDAVLSIKELEDITKALGPKITSSFTDSNNKILTAYDNLLIQIARKFADNKFTDKHKTDLANLATFYEEQSASANLSDIPSINKRQDTVKTLQELYSQRALPGGIKGKPADIKHELDATIEHAYNQLNILETKIKNTGDFKNLISELAKVKLNMDAAVASAEKLGTPTQVAGMTDRFKSLMEDASQISKIEDLEDKVNERSSKLEQSQKIEKYSSEFREYREKLSEGVSHKYAQEYEKEWGVPHPEAPKDRSTPADFRSKSMDMARTAAGLSELKELRDVLSEISREGSSRSKEASKNHGFLDRYISETEKSGRFEFEGGTPKGKRDVKKGGKKGGKGSQGGQGGQKIGNALIQTAYGVEDAATSFQLNGVTGAIRGSLNNLNSVLVSMIPNPAIAAGGVVLATALGILIPLIVEWSEALTTGTDKTKEFMDNIEAMTKHAKMEKTFYGAVDSGELSPIKSIKGKYKGELETLELERDVIKLEKDMAGMQWKRTGLHGADSDGIVGVGRAGAAIWDSVNPFTMSEYAEERAESLTHKLNFQKGNSLQQAKEQEIQSKKFYLEKLAIAEAAAKIQEDAKQQFLYNMNEAKRTLYDEIAFEDEKREAMLTRVELEHKLGEALKSRKSSIKKEWEIGKWNEQEKQELLKAEELEMKKFIDDHHRNSEVKRLREEMLEKKKQDKKKEDEREQAEGRVKSFLDGRPSITADQAKKEVAKKRADDISKIENSEVKDLLLKINDLDLQRSLLQGTPQKIQNRTLDVDGAESIRLMQQFQNKGMEQEVDKITSQLSNIEKVLQKILEDNQGKELITIKKAKT